MLGRLCLNKSTTLVVQKTCYELQLLTSGKHVQHSSERAGSTFYVPDKKMGLGKREKIGTIESARKGLGIIQEGIPKFQQEIKDKWTCDIKFIANHLDYEYLTEFKGKESLKDWVVSADSDLHDGKSKANLTLSLSNKALFYGYLNTDKPTDGIHKKSGFCNLRSPYNKKSFERVIPYDWGRYTHMYLKVRGDGRNYLMNIQMDKYFDNNWHDMYNYPLYTRGGPYWQLVKIPFSKFYFGNSGRIQDRQERLELTKVSNFSISVMDSIAGQFQLEIDYIALVRDNNDDEGFEYEMYEKSMYDI